MKKSCKCVAVLLLPVCAVVLGLIAYYSTTYPGRFSVTENTTLTLNGMVQASDAPAARGTTAVLTEAGESNTYQSELKLWGIFPIKEVTVQVVKEPVVTLCGTPFGIKMYTDGVLVVGMSAVDTAGGVCNPAKEAGIRVGDVILSIDGESVSTTDDVAEHIESCGGATLHLCVRRHNLEFEVQFTPAKSVNENQYKAGMWVRDSSAGIGTLTFYDASTGVFAGLGHAVCDVDTGEALPISTGEIVPARIFAVNRGVVGQAGQLRGSFEAGTLGTLQANVETGVYGTLSHTPNAVQTVPVAMKQQVKTGKAQVLTTIDGTTPQYYDIQIVQVQYNDSSPTRNMVIEITDERLLSVTGGIVQGMSGSPIVQDGRLVGAVTHVFVNDPTQGFAIFAENMLKTAQTVEVQQDSAA